ncbi:hypothetical protein L1987_63696 [Smallanthus sonchifolius]|uniref:Uncharacterized protein n=1 Tax=Smallanthus sonchifolius TaxID=185202 RepID=A0ACB9CE10_9ASTR|nr:hypothetical protein L1987_63696 [Smallanthus sonchifolius]
MALAHLASTQEIILAYLLSTQEEIPGLWLRRLLTNSTGMEGCSASVPRCHTPTDGGIIGAGHGTNADGYEFDAAVLDDRQASRDEILVRQRLGEFERRYTREDREIRNVTREIVDFLNRSRISYAISADPIVSRPYLEQFWETAEHDCTVTPNVIRATVAGHDIAFSEYTIRRVLQFRDLSIDPTAYPDYFVEGCWWQRMGYVGARDYASYKKMWVLD